MEVIAIDIKTFDTCEYPTEAVKVHEMYNYNSVQFDSDRQVAILPTSCKLGNDFLPACGTDGCMAYCSCWTNHEQRHDIGLPGNH